MANHEKVIEFFNKLSQEAKINHASWETSEDSVFIHINHSVLVANQPKTHKGIVLAIGTKLYEKLGINHPLIDPDRERGKQYDIIKLKDGSFRIIIPIALLKEIAREKAAIKGATSGEIKLTDEHINNAIEYLNGPNRASFGIDGLHDNSHVITITPIKNDLDNYQLKIKSHSVRLGRSQAIEANISTVIMPIAKIREYAERNLLQKRKQK